MVKAIKFLLLGLFFTNPAFAQVDSVAMSRQYYDMGMEIFNFEHRRQAKDMFVLATDFDPSNAEAHLMAGKSIMLTVHKEEALPHFMDAWIIQPTIDEEILYLIGQAYQYSEKFDSAITFYNVYNKRLARSMKFKKSLKINEVNHRIFECRNAKIYKYYPVDVEISNLGTNINTEWPDYAPTITADGNTLVFTSRRPDDNVNPSVAEDLDYYEDIYISTKENGQWTPARNMGPPLNTLYHNASINLSPDGKNIFIYSDNNGGDVYESDILEDGTWTTPYRLKGEVNSTYLENSASVSADGRYLYFSSDRPGGYGGTDIYMATKNKSGAWLNPQNLGATVNTEFDEEGVYISSSGLYLFYSSNGHAGMGDLDIYRAEYDSANSEWFEPLNLGYPINSVENDIFITMSHDERYAYYSSVQLKTSHGEQDIYMIDMINWKPVDLTLPVYVKAWNDKEERKAFTNPVSEVDLKITVVDEVSLEPMSAKVSLISEDNHVIMPDSEEIGVYGMKFNNEKSEKYQVRITQDGYLPHISDIFILGKNSETFEINETIALQRASVNFSAVINVYFGHDSDIPNTFEDINYMELLLRESKDIKVEISGYTDDTGPPEYNKDLSKRRAEAVRKHLIESGIDGERIVAIGYGEENPKFPNDTKRGRRLNRRIEFKITGR